MSYVRFGSDGSDVYIYGGSHQGQNSLECCGCIRGYEDNPDWVEPAADAAPRWSDLAGMMRSNGQPHSFHSYQGMLDHLAMHREQGDCVPAYVDEEIRGEMALPDGHEDRWLPNELAAVSGE